MDIRVRAAAARAGAPVLSPLSGVVRAARDGEPDGAFRTAGGAAAVAGKECGNGVVIVAAEGLEAQLCHLRQGSVRIRAGQAVAAGEAVGLIGQSGASAFPHVHLTVRRGGRAIDPGSGEPIGDPGCRPGNAALAPGALWSPAAQAALPFRQVAAIADWGFVETPPGDPRAIDLAPPASGRRSAPALVFYAAFAAARAGDRQTLRLSSPAGVVIAELEETQPTDQAQMVRFVGRRAPPGGFAPGAYVAEATLARDGVVLGTRREELIVR